MSYGAVGSGRRTSGELEDGGEDSRPLLGEDGDTEDIKVEMPELPHITRQESVHIPDDILKTLLCAVFMGCGSLATAFSIALVHERMPPDPPLPDVILDHVKYEDWGLRVSEYLIVTNMVLAGLTVLLHRHRMVIFRRIFIILGLLYFYRSVTMYITALPKPDPSYPCAPKLNHTITFSELMSRVIQIAAGGGLSLGGTQVYCGDFIFSGHTLVLMMSFFVIREYSPRTKKFLLFHLASLCICVAGVVLLLLSRGHYSIDCLLAYWVTSRVWWTYHTLASNSALHLQGSHNHLDNIWWWWLLVWAEAGVGGAQLPRRYSLPAPASVQRAVTSRWRLWRYGERTRLVDTV